MSGTFNAAVAIGQADYYASIGYHEGRNNDNIFTQWQTGTNDQPWCTDDQTEILTTEGWKDWTSIEVGDDCLTLNPESGLSEWQPVLAVHRFPAERRRMLAMEGKTHSSLTTENHRWIVEGRSGDRRWTTSVDGFKSDDAIPTAARCVTLPTVAKYEGAFVELVAWYITEGNRNKYGIGIKQSYAVNDDKCARIRAACYATWGAPIARGERVSSTRSGWREARNGEGMTLFSLSSAAAELFDEVAPDKVPTTEFLVSLTQGQLDRFIEACVLADGTRWGEHGSMFSQKEIARIDALQMACVLAGRPSRAWVADPVGHGDGPKWMLTMGTRRRVWPRAAAAHGRRFKIEWVDHDGPVWCVSTPNRTWLARRNGSVWFTGNCDSFVCYCAYQGGYRFPWYSLFGARGDWNVGTHHYHAIRQGLWRDRSYVASPGDLVVLTFGIPDQHIEMVRGDSGGYSFATVGGNTGDMVAFRTRYRSNVVGFIALTQDTNQNANIGTPGAPPPNYAVIGEPMHPNQPVRSYRLRAGNGAIVLHGDGGIFCYGNAKFHGSIPGDKGYVPFDMTKEWAQDLLVTPSEQGYWILTSLGHVFTFGDAKYHGGFATQANGLAIAVNFVTTDDPNVPYIAERADGRAMRPV